MTSFGSTIDDPEKHFLGDLLADDEQPLQQRCENNMARGDTTEIPKASVISGPSPVSVSSYWPEPPPPYSEGPSWTPPSQNFNRVFHNPRKEPSQWDSFLMGGNPNSSSNHMKYYPQQSSGYQFNLKPVVLPSAPLDSSFSISSVLLDDDNSCPDLEPAPACPTPANGGMFGELSKNTSNINNGGRFSRNFNSKQNRNFHGDTSMSSTSPSSCSRNALRSSQLTPPPPEPIHKLPFSYRDVVGRGAVQSNSSTSAVHQPAQQRNSAPISTGTTPPQQQKQRLGSASSVSSSTVSGSTNHSENVHYACGDMLHDDKSKRHSPTASDTDEFQKITRKKGGLKAEKVVPVLPDSAATLDGASRWDVLKTLSPRRAESRKSETLDSDLELEKENDMEANNAEAERAATIAARKIATNSNTNTTGSAYKKQKNETRKQRSIKRKSENVVLTSAVAFFACVCVFVESGVKWLAHLLSDVALMLYILLLHTMESAYQQTAMFLRNSYLGIMTYFTSLCTRLRHTDWKRVWRGDPPDDYGRWGLEHNVELPTSGDGAISRLLRCQSQDAYVILGLRADCTDEDIKKYYKKQSLLIHPDKNSSDCAEEAFRVLKKAYEMIGTPENRRKYNLANINKNPLHGELEELWEKLRTKVDEIRRFMVCDCGGKHERVLMEGMNPQEARYCARCATRHPVKQSEIWAESRFFGLIWVYFTCVDGNIYDISQWANCEVNQLKHLKPNSHNVQYRLVNSVPPPALGKFPGLSGLLSGRLDDISSADGTANGAPPSHQDAQSHSITFRPPDRTGEDRPRKANNRRQRKR